MIVFKLLIEDEKSFPATDRDVRKKYYFDVISLELLSFAPKEDKHMNILYSIESSSLIQCPVSISDFSWNIT